MLNENLKDMNEFFSQYNPSIDQKEKISRYIEFIEEWSAKTNLVSSSDRSKIAGKHIVESMLFNDEKILKGKGHIVDLGSGAGFPGIPLKIFNPELSFTLVESRKMKALFLQDAINCLELSKTFVLCERIENTTADNFSGYIDVITARAVANMKKLWSWTHELLNSGGILVLIKGGDVESEAKEAQKVYGNFDVSIEDTQYVSLTKNALFKIKLVKK